MQGTCNVFVAYLSSKVTLQLPIVGTKIIRGIYDVRSHFCVNRLTLRFGNSSCTYGGLKEANNHFLHVETENYNYSNVWLLLHSNISNEQDCFFFLGMV